MQAFLKSKYTWSAVLVLIIAGGVWFITVGGDQTGDATSSAAAVGWGNAVLSTSDNTARTGTNTKRTDADKSTVQVDFANPKTFTHEKRGFSFKYPQNLRVGRFDQGETEMIVVQNPDKRAGFQISIRPIDEEITMTKKRIKEDLPDLEVRQPQPVQLGQDAGQGLAFYSDNKAFGGNSREVWFTFNDYLYQISTYANMDPLLKQVLNTWTFR